MNELTFENVKKRKFDLVYKIPKEVGESYENLTSFNRGRDFNKEVIGYMESFVSSCSDYVTNDNVKELNERLVNYNKLVVDLRTNILRATTIPSILISGGGNYPVRKKEKELARIHTLEKELYADDGKHACFLENTRKMFDPVRIALRAEIELMRQKRAVDVGWKDFFMEVEHDEIAGYGISLADNRVYIKTHGKPDEETRTILKKGAMRWSPKNERWQRILTPNAINSLRVNVFAELGLEVPKEDFIKE